MTDIVLMILGRSLEAAVVICAVLLLRFAFRKLPKSYACALWMLVLFRLLCPVAVTSSFSLIPDLGEVRESMSSGAWGKESESPAGQGVADFQEAGGGVGKQFQEAAGSPAAGMWRENRLPEPAADNAWRARAARSLGNFWRTFGGAVSLVWAAGVLCILAACLIPFFAWKRKTAVSSFDREQTRPTRWGRKERIKEGGCVEEPFVCGILRPVIYLPDKLDEREREYILCHERMHIRHGDPLLRLLWQAALAIHWLNPLVWLAVRLVQKDMEMFCDEGVMKRYGNSVRQEYAMTLLRFAVKKSGLPFPVAFGESNAEHRIRHILRENKPALAAAILAVLVLPVAAVLLLTNPGGPEENETADADTREGIQEETAEDAGEGLRGETAEPEEGKEGEKNAASGSGSRPGLLLELAESWGRAFTGRDGRAMEALLIAPHKMQENGYEKMSDGSYEVGWSSPWPWEDNFQVNYAYDGEEIVLYYYAVTSDPMITVWKQVLTVEEDAGEYRVADWVTDMDPVSSAAGFRDRYHYENPEEYGITQDGYRFRHTPLDWFWTSGLYEESTLAGILMLQETDETEGDTSAYQTPETAAARQLNLDGGRAIRVESPDPEKVCLRWEFADGQTDIICLKRAGLLPDGSGRESSLWLVEDILEEKDWQALLDQT